MILKILIEIGSFIKKHFSYLLGFVFFLWTVLGIINDVAWWNNTENDVSGYFDKTYEVEIFEENIKSFGEPSVIVFANDKNFRDFCPKSIKNFSDKKEDLSLRSPEIRILEKRSNPLTRVFAFSKYKTVFIFKPELIKNQEHSGGNDLFIYQKEIVDLDGDGIKEIVAQVMTTACGSGSDLYNFIFSYKNGAYRLVDTLPKILYFNELPTNSEIRFNEEAILKKAISEKWERNELFKENEILNNGKIIKIRHTDSDTFLSYKDIDEDGKKELITAQPIWEESECHWCPHKWRIAVYKYDNGVLSIDMNFNDSLILITDNKYDLTEILGYKLFPHNMLGIISQYYGLGFLGTETKFLETELLTRKKSKIWDLLEPHYQ